MPQPPPELTLSLVARIGDMPAADWNACAGPQNPFISHAFLKALEDSASVGGRTGWLPQHLALHDDQKRLVACAPAYLKLHSRGEYVFDAGWADALERAGGTYYPKLQIAAPFSPVPGPRLLARDPAFPLETFADALTQAQEALRCSSTHITFCTEAEQAALASAGFLPRLGVQFHFHNPGYKSFDDFLATLASRKRKQIKRERRDAACSGYALKTLQGAQITPRHWHAFHQFYKDTTDRKWGRAAYLTEAFWPLIGETLGDQVVMMVAERDGDPIAAALNLLGTDCLYGRNWGTLVEAPFLHFELCYYMAMDFAIAHKLPRVEAGAQGEHKLQRGYLPVPTYSAHSIAHPGLARGVAEYLAQERPAILHEIEALAEQSPFKKSGDDA